MRREDVGVFEREDLAAGVELLREAFERGAGEGALGRVMLEVVLKREKVFLRDVVVEVAVCLAGEELGGTADEADLGAGADRAPNKVLAAGQLGFEEVERDGIDGGIGGKSGGRGDGSEAGGAAVIREARGQVLGRGGVELVAIAGVLIAAVEEELVADDGAAELGAGDVAMEIGSGQTDLFVEVGIGVELGGFPVAIGGAMEVIGAGLGGDVDVRAGGGSLRGVEHRGVHAFLGDGLLRRGGKGFTDGVEDRGVGADGAV